MHQSISDARCTVNAQSLRYAGVGGFIVGLLFLMQHILAPGVYNEPWQSEEYFWLFFFLTCFSVLVLALVRIFSRSIAAQNVVFYLWVSVLLVFSVILTLLQLYMSLNYSSLTAICIIVCILLSSRPATYIWLMGLTFALFCAGYAILKPRPFHMDIPVTAFFSTGLSAVVGFFLERYRLTNLALSEQLAKANSELIEQSLRDPLTGAYNRRFLNGYLAHEMGYAQRYGMPLCVIMVDIDFFKKINDTYGHQVGDMVLKEAVQCFQLNLRQSDMIARFGGEEFAVTLPATALSNGMQVAEKLRIALSSYLIPQVAWTLTASFGVVQLIVGESPDSLIQRADRALYLAKNAGRNRVESV